LGVAAAGARIPAVASRRRFAAKAAWLVLRRANELCAGDDPLTAELAARREAEVSGRVYISPYNDLDVVAGQGTIAVELLRQAPTLDAVFVAVGGGGLIGGIGAYLKAVSPHTEVVGCWRRIRP
jgi:threonine dehydratase